MNKRGEYSTTYNDKYKTTMTDDDGGEKNPAAAVLHSVCDTQSNTPGLGVVFILKRSTLDDVTVSVGAA